MPPQADDPQATHDPEGKPEQWPDCLTSCAKVFRLRPQGLEFGDLETRVGRIVLAAHKRGIWQDTPHIAEVCEFHNQPTPDLEGRDAVIARGPHNLFVSIAGRHVQRVLNAPDGFRAVGPPGGGALQLEGYPVDRIADEFERAAEACEVLAKILETECQRRGLIPPDTTATAIQQFIDAVNLLIGADKVLEPTWSGKVSPGDVGGECVQQAAQCRVDSTQAIRTNAPAVLKALRASGDEVAADTVQALVDLASGAPTDFDATTWPSLFRKLRRLANGELSQDVPTTPAEAPREQAENRAPAGGGGKRGKAGAEKWRQAQDRMMVLHRRGKLPATLRQAQKLLKSDRFGESTVRTAAHRSGILKSHFGLVDSNAKPQSGESLLDELAAQADKDTRQAIERMTPDRRREAEAALQDMDPDQQAELLQTLARNPDAGRVGDVQYIENADQDSQSDDWSE
jgi:hypothetical protein